MIILVIGGSGSGKSEYAERRCVKMDAGSKIYLATMAARDEESLARIDRHRRLRAGRGFETFECHTHPERAEIPPGRTVLLESLSNLTANVMFSPPRRRADGAVPIPDGVRLDGHPSRAVGYDVAATILEGIHSLAGQAKNLVIVTDQVFSDGIIYDAATEEYKKNLARLHRGASRLADEVVEVVCGIPVVLKETSPSPSLSGEAWRRAPARKKGFRKTGGQ